MKTGTIKQEVDKKWDQKALVISLWTWFDIYIMLERFSSGSKQAETHLFQIPRQYFPSKMFFVFPPSPPPSPQSSLLVQGPSTQSPAPARFKNFNQIKFPVIKSIHIGHVNFLWVLIASWREFNGKACSMSSVSHMFLKNFLFLLLSTHVL